MLHVLLAKDLRRAWRNPIPVLINLALPLCITALIALAFGEKKQDLSLGRIRLAIVDEDDSVLTAVLRSAVTRRTALDHLDPLFVDRAAALRLIERGEVAGIVAIPTNFSHDFFKGEPAVALELIKNPAQSVHPAVLDEAAGAVVTALDALARNFPWQEEKFDYQRASRMVQEIGRRFDKTNQTYFAFVTYEKNEPGPPPATLTNHPSTNVMATQATTNIASAIPKQKSEKARAPDLSIFGYILVGMAAMFLLFIASNTMTDLQRELRFRTFERFHTMRDRLLPFIVSKVLFALVLLLICSAIMIVGGQLSFGIHWTRPFELALMTISYACFAVGMMALLGALVPGERRSSTLNDMAGMFLSLAGGAMFPVRQLPAFLRDHVSPQLPTYWYVETARELQAGNTNISWLLPCAKLLALGLVLIIAATWLYRRRFRSGLRV